MSSFSLPFAKMIYVYLEDKVGLTIATKQFIAWQELKNNDREEKIY